MFNKRKFTRFDFDSKIKLIQNGMESFGKIENLSLKGASIIVEEGSSFSLCKKDEKLCFEMHFIDVKDIIIRGNGVIVEANELNFSIRFEKVDDNYFNNLRRLLELKHE